VARYLITGGGRGIGAQLARLAVAAGHEVFVTVRAGDAPAGAKPITGVDLGHPATVARIAAELGERPLDVLINNAGVIGPERQSSLDMDFDGFARTLEINTLGPLRVAQSVLPNLRAAARHDGIARVLTITSQMGRMSLMKSDRLAYRASKAAVNKVMQGLATDLAPENIAVLLIHPGWVRTDMGGAAADVDPADSAAGILRLVETLTLASTGTFVDYRGQTLDW
jgi:NAD(P)-dependent dehydrogenase (short-subunit alcohol dehydrogenase family)